jgi:hypothetical protein
MQPRSCDGLRAEASPAKGAAGGKTGSAARVKAQVFGALLDSKLPDKTPIRVIKTGRCAPDGCHGGFGQGVEYTQFELKGQNAKLTERLWWIWQEILNEKCGLSLTKAQQKCSVVRYASDRPNSMIRFICTNCHEGIEAENGDIGHYVRCPTCQLCEANDHRAGANADCALSL